MSNGLKRSRAQIDSDGVGHDGAHDGAPVKPDDHGAEGGQWQTVKRKKTKASHAKKESGSKHEYPSITHSPHARLQTQVRLNDLQSLVLYLLADGTAPQWVGIRAHKAIRKVVVLMIPGFELEHFKSPDLVQSSANQEPRQVIAALNDKVDATPARRTGVPDRKPTSPDEYYPVDLSFDRLADPVRTVAAMFPQIWPVKAPGDDRLSRLHSPLAGMLISPISESKAEKRQKSSSEDGGKGPRTPSYESQWQDKPTPISNFVATPDQLRDDLYVLHPNLIAESDLQAAERTRREDACQTASDGWVDSDGGYSMGPSYNPANGQSGDPLAAGRSIIAIDCEMCQTGAETFELTRISALAWDGSTLFDELVKPDNPITDYLTEYSGITKEKLEHVTTTLSDIQARLRPLLSGDAILVGHSLNSDLSALKLTHPNIVDTAILYPHPRGPPFKSSLRWLSQKYLRKTIQQGARGHDSVEDARAALDLVKLKCQRGPTWGTPEASGESIFKRISRAAKPQSAPGDRRNTAMVDWGDPIKGYGSSADFTVGCGSDQDVVNGVIRAVNGDEDGAQIPAGGADFVWGRMRELEAKRGWWESSASADVDGLRRRIANCDEGGPTQSLGAALSETIDRIKIIYDALPKCSALLVYSGNGDPRELSRLKGLYGQFKKEYRVKKWDELSVQWTDVEEQAMTAACRRAREGVAFLTVK